MVMPFADRGRDNDSDSNHVCDSSNDGNRNTNAIY